MSVSDLCELTSRGHKLYQYFRSLPDPHFSGHEILDCLLPLQPTADQLLDILANPRLVDHCIEKIKNRNENYKLGGSLLPIRLPQDPKKVLHFHVLKLLREMGMHNLAIVAHKVAERETLLKLASAAHN